MAHKTLYINSMYVIAMCIIFIYTIKERGSASLVIIINNNSRCVVVFNF